MGGSASILSPEDFVMMSQDLKEVYDTLIEEGHTDDEIRLQLMNKYTAVLSSKQAVADGAIDPTLDSALILNDDDEADDVAAATDALAATGLDGSNLEGTEPKQPLTERAKKARKRRGTFENDTVVCNKPPATVNTITSVPIETVAQ
jgi:hypothetical protein